VSRIFPNSPENEPRGVPEYCPSGLHKMRDNPDNVFYVKKFSHIKHAMCRACKSITSKRAGQYARIPRKGK
jgi:hypothetical protein